MESTKVSNHNGSKVPILSTVKFIAIDITKVLALLILIVAVPYIVWQEFRWEAAEVQVHPFTSTDTEIGLYAIAPYFCDTDARFHVKETSDEIRVLAERWPETEGPLCLFPTRHSIELDEPIGSRTVIDARTRQRANLGCGGLTLEVSIGIVNGGRECVSG